MRCAAARKLISDYIDDGLSESQKNGLKDHLELCADCRGVLGDFEKIARQAGSLPLLAPSPLSWQKIVAGMRKAAPEPPSPLNKRRGLFSLSWMPAGLRYAFAAALALVIIGGGIIVVLKFPKGLGEAGYPLAKLKEAQHYYVLAIKALDEAIGAQKNGLDPRLAGVFKRNLEDINGTIQACERVVEKDPNDLAARAYLLTVYREKVTVLEEMMGAKKASSEKRAGLAL
jgi:hypothetical protein